MQNLKHWWIVLAINHPLWIITCPQKAVWSYLNISETMAPGAWWHIGGHRSQLSIVLLEHRWMRAFACQMSLRSFNPAYLSPKWYRHWRLWMWKLPFRSTQWINTAQLSSMTCRYWKTKVELIVPYARSQESTVSGVLMYECSTSRSSLSLF